MKLLSDHDGDFRQSHSPYHVHAHVFPYGIGNLFDDGRTNYARMTIDVVPSAGLVGKTGERGEKLS